MTPDKIRRLRYKLRDELWKCFPDAESYRIFRAVDRLLPLLLRENFMVVDSVHENDCACWDCILKLNAEITMHVAMLRVKYAPAEPVPNAEDQEAHPA